jgi:hypothetical protein
MTLEKVSDLHYRTISGNFEVEYVRNKLGAAFSGRWHIRRVGKKVAVAKFAQLGQVRDWLRDNDKVTDEIRAKRTEFTGESTTDGAIRSDNGSCD